MPPVPALPPARALLEAFAAPSCLVGPDGVIGVANRLWSEFTAARGARPEDCGEGTAYVLACDRGATDSADTGTAVVLAGGLADVLAGRVERFRHDYHRSGPGGEREVSVRIAAVDGNGGRGALVSHLELTAGTAGAPAGEPVELAAALERSELVLHYQPVLDLDSGRPVGVEALVRWQHPTQGLLGPDRFLPLAEASGLIAPLGRWVLDRACRDAAALPGPLDVSVNLSVRQLAEPGLITHVRDALAASGLPAGRLILEVTESAVVQDERAAAAALDALTALGVRIALDDFGSGSSSLLYLRRYPVSALKLDRTFVAGVGTRADDEAICASVVSLARAVGAVSIAEGVETLEQYAGLRAAGCRQGQGFLWSRPVPVEELPAALLGCGAVPVPPPAGVRPASVVQVAPEVAELIASLHTAGASLHTIAAALNRADAAHPAGARWSAVAVARHLAG